MLPTLSEPLVSVLVLAAIVLSVKSFTAGFSMVSTFVVREKKLGSALSSETTASAEY